MRRLRNYEIYNSLAGFFFSVVCGQFFTRFYDDYFNRSKKIKTVKMNDTTDAEGFVVLSVI